MKSSEASSRTINSQEYDNHSKFLYISKKGYRSIVKPNEGGKNIYWTTDINTQLPIHMEKGDTPASIQPITYSQLFEKSSTQQPERVSLQVEREGKWLKWTWGQYFEEAQNFGKAMMSLNVRERSCVNIIGFNSPEWVIAFSGAILANNVPVGVYKTNSSQACLYIANHSEAEVIVCQDRKQLSKYESALGQLKNVKAFVLYLDQLPINRKHNPRFFTWKQFLERGATLEENKSKNLRSRMNAQTPGMCCNIVYTSGTTGSPKGVMLSHDNMTWGCTMHKLAFEQQAELDNQRIVSYLPLNHIAPQMYDILTNLRFRACIYFAKPDALQGSLVQTLKKVKPTLFKAVPRVWEKIEEKMKDDLAMLNGISKKIANWARNIGTQSTHNLLEGKSMPLGYSLAKILFLNSALKDLGLQESNFYLNGSAPLKQHTANFFNSLHIPIQNCYGMSETMCIVTISINKPHQNNIQAGGKPIPGCEIIIAKKNPADKQGQICFRGRNMFMGYLKNEEETRKTIDNHGYVHSGDLGHFDSKGFIHITGRIKELILTAGGENVAPVLIEDKIKELCPIISGVMVVGEGRKYIGAIFTIKSKIDMHTGEGEDQLPDHAVSVLRQEGIIGEKEDAPTPNSMISNAKILQYIQAKVEILNNKHVISRAARIRKWKIVPGSFTVIGGHLTPTMKLKRKAISKIYAKEIESLYPQPKL